MEIMNEILSIVAVQTICSADPEEAAIIFHYAPDNIIGQSVLGGEVIKENARGLRLKWIPVGREEQNDYIMEN
jgi:hypothetical protein